MKRAVFAIFFILSVGPKVYSIDYQFIQYRVEDGLKSDIIKAIGRDSLGFIWVGSDDGLMQYNGNKFLHYPHATNSPFIKDLIKLDDGRLLVLNDLGLDEIINQVDTVIFKKIIPGTRVPTDTSIWYPKSIFEDSQGNLWIGEPQSVVRYNGSQIDRIEFGPEDNSSSFVRSFSFAELPGDRILISSFTGNFYIFDNNSGIFTFLDSDVVFGEVHHTISWKNDIYLASSNGIFRIAFTKGGEIKVKLIIADINASFMQPIDNENIFVASFTSASLIYNISEKSSQLQPYNLTVVNRVFKSAQDDLWLSTEKGVVLLKSQIFQKIKTESENIYIESVALNKERDKVYFSSKEHIRLFEVGNEQSEVLDIQRQGYLLSLQVSNSKLWASNTTKIHRYNQDGRIESTWDFEEYGRFIFDIVLDREENVWFTQEASEGLKMISFDGEVHFFDENHGLNKELTIARIGKDGIYTGSNEPSAYLFYKSFNDSLFKNLSVAIDFDYEGDFRIEDIAYSDEAIWMASSVGLLKQTENSLKKIELEQKFENLLVRAVRLQEGTPFLWFTNAYGLIQYNTETGEYNIYDESHGLPSNTINTRAMDISSDGIWLGTASGLAYSNSNFSVSEKTLKPYIISFISDGRKYLPRNLKEIKLPSNSYVEIIVSSPSYPSNKLRYQFRLNPDEEWQSLPENNLLSFSKLSSGEYSISFRSKKLGNYNWSAINTYQFTIAKAFYETWYFLLTISIGVILLIIVTRFITTRILIKRQQELEKLVAERTTELERVNINLVARNQELDQFVYSTSHDLSAPLKSIRGLINIANYEEDISAQRSLLERMNASVVKLETFIRDVISYSRNVRLEIRQEDVHLKQLILEILDHISNLDHFHKIRFDIQVEEDLVIKSDETRLKIILNNLLSNAVKFQKFDSTDVPFVHIGYWFENDKHFIKVSDNGQGISEEFQQKIFHMFYRATVDSDGSGLGLYILKETIHKLNGEVELNSREGKGSEFIVSFP